MRSLVRAGFVARASETPHWQYSGSASADLSSSVVFGVSSLKEYREEDSALRVASRRGGRRVCGASLGSADLWVDRSGGCS
jgi:hypothetical protein